MSTTRRLASLGQSLWLDTITRDMLENGTLARYIAELDVTGLTSNPTIYDKAIGGSSLYDADVAAASRAGRSAEETFFSLALDDLRRAADLFRPIHERTQGGDGYVSLEVSPLLAFDTAGTEAQAAALHARAERPNLLIKIPGTTEGLPAIERSIFDGIPVNVTLLFSPAHALACAEAYTRGIERRLEAGRSPAIGSVASLFISRWDGAVDPTVPPALRLKAGLAVGRAAYAEYLRFFASPRWQRIIDIFATLVLLFVVTVQTYTLFDKVVTTKADHIVTMDLQIPIWPFYLVAWIGDVSAVLLIAIRTFRLIFHPEQMREVRMKPVE